MRYPHQRSGARGDRRSPSSRPTPRLQYFPPLQGIAKHDGRRLIAPNKAECTPALVEVRSMIADREYSQCDVWRETALERVEEAAPGTVVVDTPAAPDEIPACVSEHLHQLSACAFPDSRGWNQEFETR